VISVAKDDNKEYQRNIKAYNAQVSKADAKESETRQLTNEQKKNKAELQKLLKTRTKLYDVNESKDRQFQAQKMQEYSQFAEKEINAWDPYDNTPSSKKSGVAALGYAAQAQTNNLLERILKSQDNNPFNASLLNLHQQQVTLLSTISENIKAMRGVMAPTNKSNSSNEYKEYQVGVGDTAKYLASLRFDKAAGSYMKAVGSKLDSTGEIGLALMALGQFKELAKDGGIYKIIKEGITGAIKTTILGSKNAREWDKMKEDPAAYIQDVFNRAAGSKNAGIRALAEPLYTTNKIDLQRKMNKTDWAAGAKFDNKFYKSVIGSYETLREILGAIKGTKTTQFDWESETYRTESEIYLRQISKNEDKLKNVRRNMKNELASIMQEMGNDPTYAPFVRNNLKFDSYGNVKRDIHGNAQWTSDKIIKYVEKYIQSTGGRFDNMGDDLRNIVKSMGIDISDPNQAGVARQAMEVLGMLRNYYRTTTYAMKERLNGLSSDYVDLHGRNTYNQIDNRIGTEAIQTLQAMYDMGMNNPAQIRQMMNNVDLSVSLPRGGNFGGGGFPGGTINSNAMGYANSFTGYNNAKAHITQLMNGMNLKQRYKTNKEAARLLQGDWVQSPMNVATEFDLKNLNMKDKASELKRVGRLSNNYYDIVMGNTNGSAVDSDNANKFVEREYKKYEACVKLYEIIHRAGATAQAYAAKHGGSVSKYKSQGYISSPTDLMDCVDENGKINQSKMAKLGWGFVSDSYIANEQRRQRTEDSKYNMDGNLVQNTNKLISSVWQDSTIQKKLRIGGGSAVGLAIGSMLKNKGIISSNLGVYTMGAIGAGVMMTERAKNAIDMMYGPDSETKGEHGYSNREIGMAKLAQKVIPAAAAATVGGKAFMFSQRIFNSMGPVAGMVGFIPSLGAALAAGGITYKLIPTLRNKLLNTESGKGILGKLKDKIKENKTLANIFGLSGERSNAAIYADNIEPIIKELEVDIAKLRQENPYDSDANLKEGSLRALKDYYYKLKAIDKDNHMSIEDKNSQASQIYDGIVNLIKDQQKELFTRRTASDIDARNKAKAGNNAAEYSMTDHNKRRAQDNIDRYNTAKNVGVSSLKNSYRSKESYAVQGSEGWAKSRFKTSYSNVQEANKLFNTFRGENKVQAKANFMQDRKNEYFTHLRKMDPIALQKILTNSGMISEDVKFKDDNEFFDWLEANKEAVYTDHLTNDRGVMNDFIAAQMDAKFGKELGDIFRGGNLDDSLFDRFSASVGKNAVTEKNIDRLAKSGEAYETAILKEQAMRALGYVDNNGNLKKKLTDDEKDKVDAYIASRYFERNLQNTSIRLDPKLLQEAMKDNRIFDWINGKSNSTGIGAIDEFLRKFEHIDGVNTNSINGPAFRQMFGGWLIRQAYMAGLSNTGHLNADSYNQLFEDILKEYVIQANNFKDSNYKKKLENLTKGDISLTNKYGLDSLIPDIQEVYKRESDPSKRLGIVNSMLIDQYANGNLSGEDFGDIIGGQYVAGEEFNKLVALRRAIVKNPDGSDIPDEEHKAYIMDRINKFNSNGFFGRLMNKFGIRFMQKMNGLDEEDIAEEKVADKVLIHALTNMYNTNNLANTPYYKRTSSVGADGYTQYNWTQDGTIGNRAPRFPNPEELRSMVQNDFAFNMERYAFGSGAGYGVDTANANMYSSKSTTLKMSDLSGYSFNNGANLDTFGCSIAAINNALVILKIPTLSKETMINIANQYLDKYGIKYGFFTHIANMLGIKSEILMADGNRFNKDFFNKLKFTNATYIALLDNIGHDSGAHYVNILSVSGDNVNINDPMQNGLNDLSISEITARASFIIRLDTSNVTSKISSVDTSIQARTLNQAGSGIMGDFANQVITGMARNYVKNNGFNPNQSTPAGKDYDEGLYDPQVAIIATNVSDEKQKQGILSFMASSKNKAFAAAANRFRSLLSKPELKDELKERQVVADTQEQQGKDISEMKDAIVNGGVGGSLSADQIQLLTQNSGGGFKNGILNTIGGGLLLGGLKKFGRGVKNKFAKLFAKKASSELAESGAESIAKRATGEAVESAFESGGQEILEDGVKTVGKVASKADDVAEIASSGSKIIKGLNKVDDFITSMTDKVWQALNYVVVKLPVKIAKKLANSKLFGWICKLCGKNSDTLISRMVKSLTKMTKKLVSKVSNSMIGNAIKKCVKKAVATIGLVIDTGQFLWAWYKGTKNAGKYLDMEKDGFTQDWLESKDLNDNVGLHYAWYDSGISLVTSLLATGVEWGSLGTSTASGMSFAIQVVGFIFEQILHAFRSFGNYLKDTDLMKEMKTLLVGDKQKTQSIGTSDNKIESEMKKDLQSASGSSRISSNNVSSTKAGNTNTYDKGGELPGSNAGTSGGSSSSSSNRYTSYTTKINDFTKKFANKGKNMLLDAFNKSFGVTANGTGAYSTMKATFDWSKMPTPAALKNVVFTKDPVKNERAKKFMGMILPIAQEMSQKGMYVDPYLAMSQWALESDWGSKDSGDYNYWGIKVSKDKANWGPYWSGKARSVDTHEIVDGHNVAMKDNFRAYNSPDEAIRDYFWFTANMYPDIATKGTEGLMTGKYGAYATGVNYLGKVNEIYNQFSSGMSTAGIDMAKVQSEFANNANVPYINMGTGTGNLGNLVYSGGKWNPSMVAGKTGYAWASPLNNLGGTEIASVFGDRSDVAADYERRGLKMSRFHRGVDFAQGSGSPFFAIADGQVIQAGGGSVNNIKVKHDNGIVSEYMHGHPTVKIGDRVIAGQQIGKVGKVGTGGAHLHLGMFNSRGEYLDPFFELGLDPKNVRTRNSPENIRFLKSHNFNTKAENPTTAQAGRKLDSTGNMTKGDKGGDLSGGLVKFDNGDLIKELRDLKLLIGSLINVVSSGINNGTGGITTLLQGLISAVKSKDKDDILSQISTARFN
jgi:peptidase